MSTHAAAPRARRTAPAPKKGNKAPAPRTWRESPGFPWFPADEEELERLATSREAVHFFIWRATQQWDTLNQTQHDAILAMALTFDSPDTIAHAIGRLLVEALRTGEPELFGVAVAAYRALSHEDRRHFEDRLTGERTFTDWVIRAHEDEDDAESEASR